MYFQFFQRQLLLGFRDDLQEAIRYVKAGNDEEAIRVLNQLFADVETELKAG